MVSSSLVRSVAQSVTVDLVREVTGEIKGLIADTGGGGGGGWVLASGNWDDAGVWDDASNWMDAA